MRSDPAPLGRDPVEWSTPGWLSASLYAAMEAGFGHSRPFGLDPCSPTLDPARAPIWAERYYTRAEDGLTQPWSGRVYLCPPGTGEVGAWTARAREAVRAGEAELVVGLIPARVPARWWSRDVAHDAHFWFLHGRMRFGTWVRPAPYPAALAVWGGDRGGFDRASFLESLRGLMIGYRRQRPPLMRLWEPRQGAAAD
ncbi:MAG: hypothetical protein FJX46_09960 [Alphaproteobacteria bacterium]|nr:hypothetical protein [Alphaproteobacteria bacterium]